MKCATVYGIVACNVTFILFLTLCYSLASHCEDKTLCRLQVMGHVYPGLFMLLLAWSWKQPKYRIAECWGMVSFWLLYWIIDFIQHKGVDFSDLKTMQHYAFTMFVGVAGLFRLLPSNRHLDSFVIFVLILGFGIFVQRHPQPNDIGTWMHTITAMWLAIYWPAYVLKATAEGTAFLVMAATYFIFSQLALTSFASKYMDVVAYFSCVAVFGFGLVTLFKTYTPAPKENHLPDTDPKNNTKIEPFEISKDS